ncbi:MAG TPA: hypothetical protein VH134_01405, partial [Candidatus Dormibacteraeota bacterium]|nr:hypothetical protein [Candidatus Dormibacteraeota bacterium]
MLSRRLATLLLAAALVSPALSPSQAVAATTVVYQPTLKASLGSGQPARDFTEPFSSPAVGDLFGNGQKEIVTGALNGVVSVFDSSLHLLHARNLGGAIQASPTLADLNDDGRLEIVVPDRNGWVHVLNNDLSDFGGHWPQHSLYGMPWANLHFTPDFFASAAVGSLFGDGTQDVVATSWDHRVYAWDASGNPLGGFPINLWDTVSASPLLVDLEGRGQLDIVVGSDSLGPPTEPNPQGGEWWAFRPDGSLIWKRNQDEVPWSSPAAAILNPGDPFPSVVGATGHYFAQTGHPAAGRYVNVYT